MKDYLTAYVKMQNECLNSIPKALKRGCGVGHEICFATEGCNINTCPKIVFSGELRYVTAVFENKPYNEFLLKTWFADPVSGMPDEPSDRYINIKWLDLSSLVNICDGIRKWKQTYGR